MKYEKYKDSGVEWIGEIPEHWEVTRLKNLIEVHYSGVWGNESDESINDRNCIRIADFDFGNLTINEKNLTKRNYSDKEIEKYELRKGDILVEKSGGGDKTPVGRVVFFGLEESSLYANFIEMLRVKSVSKKFIAYLLSSMYHSGLIYTMFNQTTGIQNLNIPKYITQNIVLPKDNFEQEKITIYLDKKTEKIDSIIKSLEDQKENLEQYKRELIAEVITKGLNNNIPMKDSGVDWIGEVPEHWEVKKIKWIFKILKRQNGRDDRQVLSITQQGIKIKDIENNDGQMAESYENYQLVEPGDFAMNSMDLLTGWIDCSQYEGVTSPDYRVFRLIDINDHNNDFYNYLFQMCYTRRIFYRIGQGVSNLGRWRLQREPFLNMKVPVPPKAEQDNISSFIRIKENKINVIVNEVEKQTEKLKEYRKILIHEAVTGKVKIDGGAK